MKGAWAWFAARRERAYTLTLIALSVGGLCVCWYFAALLWDNLLSALHGTKDNSADIRNLLLGFAALVAAPFAILRVWIAERQAKTAEQGLVTDRFTKAVEQLGATKENRPDIPIRIGAIYSLNRIALDSERDRLDIMNILLSYMGDFNKINGQDLHLIEGNTGSLSLLMMRKILKQYKNERLDISICYRVWEALLRKHFARRL